MSCCLNHYLVFSQCAIAPLLSLCVSPFLFQLCLSLNQTHTLTHIAYLISGINLIKKKLDFNMKEAETSKLNSFSINTRLKKFLIKLWTYCLRLWDCLVLKSSIFSHKSLHVPALMKYVFMQFLHFHNITLSFPSKSGTGTHLQMALVLW